ncbi:MAG TPA: hypothetical protein PKH80_04265 [Methanofastidiosum sp.]|nr:hypothetical protein [Methanofastidiosum sp.]HNU61441.1 hypothetical protein [Methanofastidiosum sp.]
MEITGEVKLNKNQNASLIEKKLKALKYRIVEVTADKILIANKAQKGEITLGKSKAKYRISFSNYNLFILSLLIFLSGLLFGYILLEIGIIGYFGFRNILLITILTAISTHDATRASIQNTITNKVFGQKDFFLENLNRKYALASAGVLAASYLLEYEFTLTPRFLAGSGIAVLVGIIFYYKYPKEVSKRDRPIEESKYKSRRKIWYITSIILSIPLFIFAIFVKKDLGAFIMLDTMLVFFLREMIIRDFFDTSIPFKKMIIKWAIFFAFILLGGLISFIEYLKGGY